ncbi:hypothetical protein GO730_21440 [Spirosoma sp. HMF3257]|uniref:Glycosyl transferase n=1 Tax=Spirosoma telluris TaxID=2183553 RepID=A0A327NQ11_9BACT|nr:hypothetical protein [Spirosoma telluris]RAI76096.1 hypothetical protein HMF3257_21360 [Spirosoma telluris]
MQAVFTIVAKNYIPLANILGDSLRQHHPDITFIIVVADREDDLIDFSKQRYPIIAAENLGITQLTEMAFKYNVTEFCTALKPFCFRFLFNKGYKQVIYFDPDIYIFDKLDGVFSNLQVSSMVLTPHYNTIEENYTGLFREGNILFAGIFNLGFCALKYSDNGLKIVNWWCNRLTEQCYADRTDGLHVDQKWTDFLPMYFNDVYIEKGLGYNMAVWNWHERQLIERNGQYFIINRIKGSSEEPLIFYHFSNYHFKEASALGKFMPIQAKRFNDINHVSQFYADLLIKENIASQLAKLAYSYASFDNGTPIAQFHRRFYRRLIEIGEIRSSPFETVSSTSYHNLLKRNRLLGTSSNLDKLNESNFEGFDHKLKLLNRIAKLIKFIIGFEKYALLCKFMYRYVRAENQAFLIEEHQDRLPFVNENRYINTHL